MYKRQVFTLNSASEIAELSGYLADLSDLDVMGKVQENLIAMVDGNKSGVPMTAEGFGIIYNKNLVDPEAISTMDEMCIRDSSSGWRNSSI